MAYAVSATHTLDKPILQGLDVVSTTDSGQQGLIVQSSDGRKYKYCNWPTATVGATAGYPAWFMVGTTANQVTGDYTDTTTAAEVSGCTFAGVFCGTVTTGTAGYGWIELPNGAVTADASVSTNVGVCDTLTAVSNYFFDICASDQLPCAVAMEADTAELADIVMI